jgi:hypothetical protein
MKKSDLDTGVLYARQRSSTYAPTPAVLLDKNTLWKQARYPAPGAPLWVATRETKPAQRTGWTGESTGYLIITGRGSVVAKEMDDFAAEITALDLPVELTPESVTALGKNLPDGLELAIVSNRELSGPWASVWAQHQKEKEQRQIEIAAEQQREKARHREYETVKGLLPDGVTVTPTSAWGGNAFEKVEISVADLRRLVDLASAAGSTES